MCITAHSQQRSAYAFTGIPGSAVTAALGGSQVGLYRGDLLQRMDNPAFVDSSMHQAASFSYLSYLESINQASLSYGHRFDSLGFASAYLRYFDYGTFQETDEVGNELGQFKVVDYEVGLTFGASYNKYFSYGATLKQVFSNMYQNFGYGAAIDLGLHYKSEDGNLTAGLVARNLGFEIIDYTSNTRDPFPWGIDLAIAKKFDKAPILFGLQYSDLQRWDLAGNDLNSLNNLTVNQLTGDETRRIFTLDNFARHLSGSVAFIPSEKFSLMLGYNFRRRLELATAERPALVGFSFGTNIQIKRFGIQYAITSYHLNGASNHFGITTNFSEWYGRKQLK